MIHKIDFSAKSLTSTNNVKINHIKTVLCGNYIGIDKLEQFKLLQSAPLINELAISIFEPKMDYAKETEYRQQIKTFRLKHIFLAGKIIRTARSVVMSFRRNIRNASSMKQVNAENPPFFGLKSLFLFKSGRKNHFRCPNS